MANQADANFALESLFKWQEEIFGRHLGDISVSEDWKTIVALHAMVETGLNNAISKEMQRPELEAIISKLDTSGGAASKRSIAEALGIISDTTSDFIRKLSEIRNHCVHNIANFDFSIDRYLNGLNEGERESLLRYITRQINRKISDRSKKKTKEDVSKNVGFHLHAAILVLLMDLFCHDILTRIKLKIGDANAEKLFMEVGLNQSKPNQSSSQGL